MSRRLISLLFIHLSLYFFAIFFFFQADLHFSFFFFSFILYIFNRRETLTDCIRRQKMLDYELSQSAARVSVKELKNFLFRMCLHIQLQRTLSRSCSHALHHLNNYLAVWVHVEDFSKFSTMSFPLKIIFSMSCMSNNFFYK